MLSEDGNKMLEVTYFRSYGDLDEVFLPSGWVYQSVLWCLPFAQEHSQRARNAFYTKQVISERHRQQPEYVDATRCMPICRYFYLQLLGRK
jgi:hypothetical protein